MATKQPGSLLRKYGAKLLENGYSILPIPSGKKGPVEPKWQSLRANPNMVRAWSEGKYKHGNIGFHTRLTPAVDIDIYDEKMSALMAHHAQEIIGKTITRVGQAPKTMLIYRTDAPFSKQKITFIDLDGVEHSIEVLGDGQQFVGIGIHPDTKRAYRWRSLEESPIGVKVEDLPEITADHIKTLFDVFKMEASRNGWTLKSHSAQNNRNTHTDSEIDSDNDQALLAFKAPLDNITVEQLREVLKWVPGNEEYDDWLKVGMALHHQFDGDEDGLALWHEWSEGASNYDADTLERKWNSFADEIGRNVTTVATLLKKAKEHRVAHAQETFSKIQRKIDECTSEVELLGTLAAKWGRVLESDYQVDLLATSIVKRVRELTGKGIRIDVVRKAINEGYKSDFDYKDVPHWCDNVVYVDKEEQFFLMDSRLALSERAFNGRNNRHLLSKKDRASMDAVPEQQASQLALNVYQVPVVSGYVYLPGAERVVTWCGNQHVNLFNGNDMAPTPEKLSKKDRRAIEIVQKHFEISYPVERERELLLSWLAYTIKRMDKKIRWAPVIQGVDGAGKGFIGEMLMAILGKNNVSSISAQALEEKYTSFFENRKIVVLEEARIHGATRYAVMDKLKPYITNDVVDIRRMHQDTYNIPSVLNLMILTNHADALPMYDADRRYFVVSTYFQTKEMIGKFRAANPDYFDDLFNAIAYHPGAIREWLEDYKLHEEFNPDGHAPHTDAKDRMGELARGSDNDELEELLQSAIDPEVTEYVLNVSRLRELATDQSIPFPADAKLSSFLSYRGFVYAGRARNQEGKMCRYWTRHPDKIGKPTFQGWLDRFFELSL